MAGAAADALPPWPACCTGAWSLHTALHCRPLGPGLQDATIAGIERRLSEWSLIPVGHGEGLQVGAARPLPALR